MSIDQQWAGIKPGELTEDEYPSPGMYVAQIREAKAFTSKAGEFTIVVGYLLPDGRQWSDVRCVTKGGVLQEGRVKAAQIMLRQLGVVETTPPSELGGVLGQIVGRHYALEVVASSDINHTTGAPFLNTNVTGPASAPTQSVGNGLANPNGVLPPARPQRNLNAVDPNAGMQFPAAVAGGAPTVVQPQAPAQALPQDQVPF